MGLARISLPPKLLPIFSGPARYRGAYGGRGSGKSRGFAMMSAVCGYMWSRQGEEGIILCGREYLSSLDERSMAEVKAAIRSEPWHDAHYEIGETYIRTRCGRIEYAFTGLRLRPDSYRSRARIYPRIYAAPLSETKAQGIVGRAEALEN